MILHFDKLEIRVWLKPLARRQSRGGPCRSCDSALQALYATALFPVLESPTVSKHSSRHSAYLLAFSSRPFVFALLFQSRYLQLITVIARTAQLLSESSLTVCGFTFQRFVSFVSAVYSRIPPISHSCLLEDHTFHAIADRKPRILEQRQLLVLIASHLIESSS